MKKVKLISFCALACCGLAATSALSISLASCKTNNNDSNALNNFEIQSNNDQLKIVESKQPNVFSANVEDDSNVNWFATTKRNIDLYESNQISWISFINNSEHIHNAKDLNIASIKNESENNNIFYTVDKNLADGRRSIQISKPTEISSLVDSSNQTWSTTAQITTSLSNFDLPIGGKKTIAVAAKSNDGSKLQYKWYVKKDNSIFTQVQFGSSPKYTLNSSGVKDPGTIWEIKVDVFKMGDVSKVLASSSCKVRFTKQESNININLEKPKFNGKLENVDTTKLSQHEYTFPNNETKTNISSFDSIIIADDTNVKIDLSANSAIVKSTGQKYSKGLEYSWFYSDAKGAKKFIFGDKKWTTSSTLDLSKLNLDKSKVYTFGYIARPVDNESSAAVQSNNIFVYFNENKQNNTNGSVEDVVRPSEDPSLGYNKSETIIYSDNIVVNKGLEETTITKGVSKEFSVNVTSNNNTRLKYKWYVKRNNGNFVLKSTKGSSYTIDDTRSATLGDTWLIKVEIVDASNINNILAVSQCAATIIDFESNYKVNLVSPKFVGDDVSEDKVINIKENDQYFATRYQFPNKDQTELLADGEVILNGDSKNVKIDVSGDTAIDEKTGLTHADGLEFTWFYRDSEKPNEIYYVNNKEWTSDTTLDLSTLYLDSNKMYTFGYMARPKNATNDYNVQQSKNIYVYFSDTSIALNGFEITGAQSESNIKYVKDEKSEYFAKNYTFWNKEKTDYLLTVGSAIIDGENINNSIEIKADYKLFNKDTQTSITKGDGTVSFTWYLNNNKIENQTSQTIKLSNLNLQSNKVYNLFCIVTYRDSDGIEISNIQSQNISICLKNN